MIGKIWVILIALFAFLFSLVYLYNNLPSEPVDLKVTQELSESREIMSYGATPVFSENLRFGSNEITYHIDSNECSQEQIKAMVRAMNIFQEEMVIIKLIRITNQDLAKIKVTCPNKKIDLGDSLYAAGEGGPSQMINTSFFNTILEGKIYLYESPKCDYPVVELHELCHVFGFDHTKDPTNIMFNTSRCEQRISPDMVELINKLYSIEALPELVLSEVSAVKKGKLMDFNVTVMNEGLISAQDTRVFLYSGDEEVQVMDIGFLEVGHGRSVKATNVRLPSSKDNEFKFIVNSSKEEYDSNNNIAFLTVPSE